MMEQKLMAFWKYDKFPYVLWGEVVSFSENGGIFVKEYGGYIFKPMIILPYSKGLELSGIIVNINKERQTKLEELELEYGNKISKIFAENKMTGEESCP